MPVEIRELVIRAVVEERRPTTAEPQRANEHSDNEREALIQACVRQVMQILRRERER
jgi:hypothetical protein